MFRRLRRAPGRVWRRTFGAAASALRPGCVALLHQHRCGSTVLGGMLGAHPRITWRSEVITYHRLAYERAHGSEAGWTCAPAALIRAHRRGHPWGWFGCEVTTRNARDLGLSLEATVDMLRRLGFRRFVVLERRNHLRRYLSSLVGEARGRLHLEAGRLAGATAVALDPESTGLSRDRLPLLEVLRRDTDEVARLLELTAPLERLHLVYEDDLRADPAVGYARVCRYLGEEPVAVAPATARTSPFPVADILSNYDEVAALLAGTPFEWMLEA